MRRTILTLTVGAMVLALAVPAAMACRGRGMGGPGMGGPGMGGPGMGMPGGMMLRGLDLSAEQQTAIDQARKTFWGYRDALHKALDAKRDELHKLWTAEQPDAQAIKRVVKDMAKIRTELRLRRVDMRLAVNQILTPEQRAQLRQWTDQRFQMRKQRRQMRRQWRQQMQENGQAWRAGPWMGRGMGGPGAGMGMPLAEDGTGDE